MGCLQSQNSNVAKQDDDIAKRKHVTVTQGVKELRAQYNINRNVLGAGAFGQVFKAVNKKDKSLDVAIKVINKKEMSPEDLAEIMDEVSILQQLDHPNIVKYFETYDDVKYLYLVMQNCSGGELFDSFEQLEKKGQKYSEKLAADVIRKCLGALQHCHSMNIVHRDIKPENIMYDGQGEIQLVDFGLAKQTRKRMDEVAGTPYFMAPEVIDEHYEYKCDIWSLGVVLYMLVAGNLPFNGYSKPEVYGKIRKGFYRQPKHCTDACRDLISKMLKVDPKNRPDAGECLKHKWFKEMNDVNGDLEEGVSLSIINNLKSFHGQSQLRKAALNIFVKTQHPQAYDDIRAQFVKIDTDSSGIIDVKELRIAIKESDFQSVVSDEEIDEIISQIDYDNNGKINYTEFIAAALPIGKYLTQDRLNALFAAFDVDDNKEITEDNIKNAFTKLGREISDDDVKAIMLQHDTDKNGIISLTEFQNMLLGVQQLDDQDLINQTGTEQ